jgi:hypothetical protein
MVESLQPTALPFMLTYISRDRGYVKGVPNAKIIQKSIYTLINLIGILLS